MLLGPRYKSAHSRPNSAPTLPTSPHATCSMQCPVAAARHSASSSMPCAFALSLPRFGAARAPSQSLPHSVHSLHALSRPRCRACTRARPPLTPRQSSKPPHLPCLCASLRPQATAVVSPSFCCCQPPALHPWCGRRARPPPSVGPLLHRSRRRLLPWPSCYWVPPTEQGPRHGQAQPALPRRRSLPAPPQPAERRPPLFWRRKEEDGVHT